MGRRVSSQNSFSANSIHHAGSVGVARAAGTMQHKAGDTLMQLWIQLRIRELSLDSIINILKSDALHIALHQLQEKTGMLQTSKLAFHCVNPSFHY